MKMLKFISAGGLDSGTYREKAQSAYKLLQNGTGKGSDFTGWFSPGSKQNEIESGLLDTAAELRENSDVTVVIGIGGSYLGAKAVIEMLAPGSEEVVFAGNNLSGSALERLLDKTLHGVDFSVIVISKSGTTTEPALAFRLLERELRYRYGTEAPKRIVAVTNPNGGAMRKIAESGGYRIFTIPDNIGGRYSVLTSAGLLPIAVAGIDAAALHNAAAEFAVSDKISLSLEYAAVRQALYASGKKLEALSLFEPNFQYLGEWFKQLFGESEGKDGKGIFPVSLNLTADLHSMGQYMQDGERSMFETFLWADSGSWYRIPESADNFDGFNNLAGKRFDDINRIALDATKQAHTEGGVPANEINIGELNVVSVGELLQFFMLSCGVSGYISGVNPFDQPGVEAYKRNMKNLM
ncbi:MAG: glucose-6-phosphate isomerase [Oscillospiraceae bacterium]|jgi:glucose-6-phosphate isomerase|nr:glucose-6-phosphate isomerase [Oscillospiraceae bacterium]